MIDCHCHLEQKEFDGIREQVIKKCKEKLKAIVTCCAHPKDFDLTVNLVEKHKGFLFCTAGIHPEFVKELSNEEIENFMKRIEENKDQLVGIGEVGLDFHHVKEKPWQEKQEELFVRFIRLAKKLNKPLVVHSRDAYEKALAILEREGMKNKSVLLHLFGNKNLIERVVSNGWYVSIGPGIVKSKTTKKIARDMPLENILLETDSPWFGFGSVGTPLNVEIACEKIAEIKKISKEAVSEQTDKNAIKFFSLRCS